MKIFAVTSSFQQSYRNNIRPFHGYWDVEILKKTDDEVLELAKYFYKSNQQELKEVTTVRTPILKIKRKLASIASYYKLKCATDKITPDIQGIKTRLAQLEQLHHLSIREAEEINTLKTQLAEYDSCFEKRKKTFWH